MFTELIPWVGFLALVAGLLALDLGVLNRHAHAPSRREALAWSALWIGVAALFAAGVFAIQGRQPGIEWTTGYLVEKSLAVDNLFVFLLIFQTFKVPPAYQHRVLFWGIVGALVMRAILIGAAGLLLTLHWVIYLFGAFLVFTGLKFLRGGEHQPGLESNWLVRLGSRFFPVTEGYEGPRFFVRQRGILFATPLFLVLLLVESTDLVFAVDSIPAIYAITDDPFIVFTSNILAILALRALYFVLADYLSGFAYLKPALAAILVFVGTKMLLIDVYKIEPLMSLGVIASILALAIAASVIKARRAAAQGEQPDGAPATFVGGEGGS